MTRLVPRPIRRLPGAAAVLRRAAAVGGCAGIIVMLAGFMVHPIHTSMTELTHDKAGRAAVFRIRVFVDDFAAAAAGHAGTPAGANHTVTDAAAFGYAAAHVGLADRRGRSLPLQWCGSRRQSDVLWICLRAAGVGDLRGLQVRNSLLFDWFDDQVNIVRMIDGTRKKSLLFTKGDGAKRLP